MLEMFTDADPMRSDDYSLPADGWRRKNNANEIGGFMDIGKLRVMNLGTVADELEQLRAYKAAIESREPAGRITEQDAREICESCLAHWLYKRPEEFHVGEWLVTKGRTLLNKLNEDRQVSDDTSDQRLWDYYQALLKHYGFDGITDLLVKYRKLAEQVPEVVVPENMVELLTKAILFQDCGSHEGWEDNIDLGKAALKVFTASLMTTPSHSQQSAVPDGLVEALVQSQFQVDADGTFIGVSRQALDEAIEIIRSLSIPSHSHALKAAGDRLEREILTVPLPEPADLVVSALVEALEEARLTLDVLRGRGSSVTLTLAIIDRALAAYRKGEKS